MFFRVSSHFYIDQNWTCIVRFYCLVDVFSGLQSLSPHSLKPPLPPYLCPPKLKPLEKTIIFNTEDIYKKTDLWKTWKYFVFYVVGVGEG